MPITKYQLVISPRRTSSGYNQAIIEFDDLPTPIRIAAKMAEVLPDVELAVQDTNNRWYARFYSWGPGTKG